MKTAQLLAGIDGAFLYKYKVSKPFQQLTVYVSTYEKGKLISKDEIMRMHENTGISEGGMFAIVPDFERFEVKLIADMDQIPDLLERIHNTHGIEFVDYDISFKGICI